MRISCNVFKGKTDYNYVLATMKMHGASPNQINIPVRVFSGCAGKSLSNNASNLLMFDIFIIAIALRLMYIHV